MSTVLDKGTGRLFDPDPQDAAYPMRLAIAAAGVEDVPLPPWGYWWHNGILDQRQTGTCVAHAWLSLYLGSPRRHKLDPSFSAYDLYRQIVMLDSWTQNDHEAIGPIDRMQFGSSVRAGAKACVALKWIEGSYTWAQRFDTAIRHVLLVGPVVVGSRWTRRLSTPDREGFVFYAGEASDGGHCYVWDGCNRTRGVARFRQSWGRPFARNGQFWMQLEDVERLWRDDGELCAPTEVRVK